MMQARKEVVHDTDGQSAVTATQSLPTSTRPLEADATHQDASSLPASADDPPITGTPLPTMSEIPASTSSSNPGEALTIRTSGLSRRRPSVSAFRVASRPASRAFSASALAPRANPTPYLPRESPMPRQHKGHTSRINEYCHGQGSVRAATALQYCYHSPSSATLALPLLHRALETEETACMRASGAICWRAATTTLGSTFGEAVTRMRVGIHPDLATNSPYAS